MPNPGEGQSTMREPGADGLANDYAAIATGAGIAAVGNRIIVRVSGDDRIPFMHGMCSNDIKGLATGAVSLALVLTEHAHIIADLFVYAEADALILEVDRSLWVKTREHLEKFLVADDVEFEELNDLGVIDVEGPLAARAIATVTGDAALSLTPWRYAEAADLRIANLPRYGAPAVTIIVDQARIATIMAALRDRGAAAGIGAIARVGAEALEIVRVERGIARVGQVGSDTSDKTIALEARLEPAISYSKGCYLGQETIERATARDGLKKRLYGLRFVGDRLPFTGGAIMLAAKEVGRLTSVVRSPRFGVIGLSILHHSAWQTGTRVTIAGAGDEFSAIVSDLPFA
jgi:folate-binding protein YgfZ